MCLLVAFRSRKVFWCFKRRRKKLETPETFDVITPCNVNHFAQKKRAEYVVCVHAHTLSQFKPLGKNGVFSMRRSLLGLS